MAKKHTAPDVQTPLGVFYDRHLRELVDEQPAGIREAVQAAFVSPPSNPDDVDPWFEKHFSRFHGEIYTRLAGAKAALRDLAALSGF